jgi:hypothetical protein
MRKAIKLVTKKPPKKKCPGQCLHWQFLPNILRRINADHSQTLSKKNLDRMEHF